MTQDDHGKALNSTQLARATSLIMLALMMSGILGLIRQMVISATFGLDANLDTFYAALRVPETLFTLVAGGALGSAFIPVFARFLAQDDFKGAWRLASTLLSLMMLGAIILSAFAFVFADVLVKYMLWRGGDAAEQALVTELMRIMLATVMIFGASGIVMGILNTYQHFLAPALAPSMYNVGIIIGAVFLAPSLGVHGLAWGVLIGSLLHLGIQLPNLFRLPHTQLQINLDWKVPGASEVLLLMGPRVLGLGVVQINFWVNASLASNMVAGSYGALTTAFTLMFVVLGVLGQSVGTAAFPTLSRLHAEGNIKAFWETLTNALSSVMFLSIPAGFGLAALAHPIITVLFERGEWTPRDTSGTAWALLLFGIGLAGHAALEILARAFYALRDTWTPVKIGGLTMLLNIVLSLFLIRVMGYPNDDNFARGSFGGLALSMSISTAIESTILWIMLRRRVGLPAGDVTSRAGKTLIAALVMAFIVALWRELGRGLPSLPLLLIGVIVGGASFWIMALVLRLEEAQIVPRMVLGKLGIRV